MSYLGQVKIFSGSESHELTAAICQKLDLPVSKSKVIKFSEGNIFVELGEKVQNQHVIIIQSIAQSINESFMELLFWIDACKRNGASKISIVIPYFSYAKSDKPDGVGTSIRGRVCADCLEMVGASQIIVMDLHSPQIQGFFRQPVSHLSAMPAISNYIKNKFAQLENFSQEIVLVSPDAGFEKNASLYAEKLGVELAIGEKKRIDHSEQAKIMHIGGADVSRKICIVVDDFTISGGTLIEITKKLKEQGATQVIACVSHALLNEIGATKIQNSDLEELIITDTVSNQNLKGFSKIKTISVADIFATAIRDII